MAGLLLNKSERNTGSNSAQAQIQLPALKERAVVLVTAHGAANYRAGGHKAAGIVLSIDAGGHVVKADSFEAQSSRLSYRAAAAHNFVVERGQATVITAKVDHYGEASQANQDSQVDLHVIALEAD